MRLNASEHTRRPWRIHELADDFRLEDVWRLPVGGSAGEFRRFVELIVARDPARSSSHAVRALFALRWKIGELLGWDAAQGGTAPAASLRERLPQDLARTAPPAFRALPFSSLYLTDDEFAAEIANRTMHGVLHLGWVPDGDGAFDAQMAVLVKPNGVLGRLYMAAIKPFRHLVVYPAMLREGERDWRRAGAPHDGRRANSSRAGSR